MYMFFLKPIQPIKVRSNFKDNKDSVSIRSLSSSTKSIQKLKPKAPNLSPELCSSYKASCLRV